MYRGGLRRPQSRARAAAGPRQARPSDASPETPLPRRRRAPRARLPPASPLPPARPARPSPSRTACLLTTCEKQNGHCNHTESHSITVLIAIRFALIAHKHRREVLFGLLRNSHSCTVSAQFFFWRRGSTESVKAAFWKPFQEGVCFFLEGEIYWIFVIILAI